MPYRLELQHYAGADASSIRISANQFGISHRFDPPNRFDLSTIRRPLIDEAFLID